MYSIDDDVLWIDDRAYVAHCCVTNATAITNIRNASIRFSSGALILIEWSSGTRSDNKWHGNKDGSPFKEKVASAQLSLVRENGIWVLWPGATRTASYVLSKDANVIINYLMTTSNFNDAYLTGLCLSLDSWKDIG